MRPRMWRRQSRRTCASAWRPSRCGKAVLASQPASRRRAQADSKGPWAVALGLHTVRGLRAVRGLHAVRGWAAEGRAVYPPTGTLAREHPPHNLHPHSTPCAPPPNPTSACSGALPHLRHRLPAQGSHRQDPAPPDARPLPEGGRRWERQRWRRSACRCEMTDTLLGSVGGPCPLILPSFCPGLAVLRSLLSLCVLASV